MSSDHDPNRDNGGGSGEDDVSNDLDIDIDDNSTKPDNEFSENFSDTTGNEDDPNANIQKRSETNSHDDVIEPGDNQLPISINLEYSDFDLIIIQDGENNEIDDLTTPESQDIVDSLDLSIKLIREDDPRVETFQFVPRSLMTIIVENTGTDKMTKVVMLDSKDQSRYHASSGGSSHEWTTRLQNTRSFGEWKLIVEGPLDQEGSSFHLKIPFQMKAELDPEMTEYVVEEVVEPIIEQDLEEIAAKEISEEEVIEIDGEIIQPLIEEELPEEMIEEVIAQYEDLELEEVEKEPELLELEDEEDELEVIGQDSKSVDELLDQQIEGTTEELVEEVKPSKYELTDISGIGKNTAEGFYDAGFNTVEDVANASINDLKQIKGVGNATAKKYKKNAIDLLGIDEEIVEEQVTIKPPGSLKLTDISGIGKKTAEDFNAAGFESVKSVAEASLTSLKQIKGVGNATAKKYKKNAMDLLGIDEEIAQMVETAPQKKSIGMLKLRDISGIGKKTAEDFKKAGFNTVEDVANASITALKTIKGVGNATAKKYKKNAMDLLGIDKEIVEEPMKERSEGPPQLTDISGIGKKTAEDFKAAGFNTVEDVLNASVDDLTKIKGVGKATATKIRNNAQELLGK